MSGCGNTARKAWMVAASIGAVEALKDQLGFCRWNYGLRTLQQHAKARVVSYNLHSTSLIARSSSSSSSSSGVANLNAKDRAKKAEKSFDKVMELGCWGPNSVRF